MLQLALDSGNCLNYFCRPLKLTKLPLKLVNLPSACPYETPAAIVFKCSGTMSLAWLCRPSLLGITSLSHCTGRAALTQTGDAPGRCYRFN